MAHSNFIKLAGGNPGASTFLNRVISSHNDILIKQITRLQIEGWQLWILYNDICGKDLDIVYKLLVNCPLHLVKKACEEPDGSGKEFVKQYL